MSPTGMALTSQGQPDTQSRLGHSTVRNRAGRHSRQWGGLPASRVCWPKPGTQPRCQHRCLTPG